MAIRSTPPISLADVMAELRIANPNRAYPLSLGDTDVRALAGKPSGPISLGDLYGRSGYAPMSISAVGGSDFQTSQFGPGSVSASATATAVGGRGAKTYLWLIGEQQGSLVLSGQNTSTLVATKAYTQNSTGSATVSANCRVTDETGAMVTSNPIVINLEWAGTV